MSEAQRLARRDIPQKNGAAIAAIVSQPHDHDWFDSVPGEPLVVRVRSSQVGVR